MNTNVGIAGEYRVVVTKADGSVKEDTGYQKNLILDRGLDFFGGGNGAEFNARCVIGSGNSAPAVNQTHLDSVVAITTGVDKTNSYAYVDEGDNLYKMWEQKKYRFEGLNNVNINEVGLVSNGTTTTNYYLTTRALIKDAGGTPTTITVNSGETLDVYYKIHKVIGTLDKGYVVNMLDGEGGSEPYNVVVRPAHVGVAGRNSVSRAVTLPLNGEYIYSTSDLAPSTSTISGSRQSGTTIQSYLQGSFKIFLSINITLNQAVSGLRTLCLYVSDVNPNIYYTFIPFQFRFGSVADDSPIPKTNKHTLTIPLEVSWGRYEGEL